MKSVKCSKCGFVSWANNNECKKCRASLDAASANNNRASTFAVPTSFPDQTEGNLKQDALKKIKYGAALTAVFISVLIFISWNGYAIRINPSALGTGLLPIAWLLAGVLELSTGIPFIELSQKWDNLAGWQRGIIGISFFFGGITFIFVVGAVVVSTIM